MDIKATIYTTTPISQKSKDFLADSLRSALDTVKTIESEKTRTNPQHTEEWINTRIGEIYNRILVDITKVAEHIMCTLSVLEDIASPLQQSLIVYNYLLMKVCKSIDSDYSTHIIFDKNTMQEKVYMLSLQPCNSREFPFKIRISNKMVSTNYLNLISRKSAEKYLTNFGIVRSMPEYVVTISVIKKLVMELSTYFLYSDSLPINQYPIE